MRKNIQTFSIYLFLVDIIWTIICVLFFRITILITRSYSIGIFATLSYIVKMSFYHIKRKENINWILLYLFYQRNQSLAILSLIPTLTITLYTADSHTSCGLFLRKERNHTKTQIFIITTLMVDL